MKIVKGGYYIPWDILQVKGKDYWVPKTFSGYIYLIRYWIGYFIMPSSYKEAINDHNEQFLNKWISDRADKLN